MAGTRKAVRTRRGRMGLEVPLEVPVGQRLLSVRSTRLAPVVELFDQGLSFQLMLSWGILPPLATMNQFLACGRDDTDAQDGLVEWDPVALTQSEYADVCRDLKQRGHDVRLEPLRAGTSAPSYEDWFASNLAKRAPKSGQRKRSGRG